MKELFSLFYTFSKIGLFTLGGGYAMLPLMEQELVDKHAWLTHHDFLDIIAVAQAAPGIMAFNTAVLVGYRRRRAWGSFWASLGTALPSFIIILLLAVFFHAYQENPYVLRIFKGVRPAVVALIAVPVFRLAAAAHLTWKTMWIAVFSALLVWLMHVSPVYIVLAAGVGGYLWAVRGAK